MIIAVSNQKGGVGKTTTTFNVGYLLADRGKKTLLIDADPQSSLTTIFKVESTDENIYNSLIDGKPIEQNIINIESNLYLLPCSIKLADFEIKVANKKGRENYFRKMLRSIRDKFDYILIDCPPSLSLLLVNILNASDKVLIPVQTDYLAYKGLDLLLNTIASVKVNLNSSLKILGVVATGYDSRTLHSKEIKEMLELLGETDVIATITNSTKVKDGTGAGKPLHRYDPSHKIVTEYKKIVERIIEDEQ